MGDIGIGSKVGRLTIREEAGRNKHKQLLYVCECECGKLKIVPRGPLLNGRTKSCGCLKLKAGGDADNIKGRAPEYNTWASMKARCTNAKSKKWPDYGGRGIKVCDRWLCDYKTFLADVGRRPSPLHSLDRIDNDGHYEPGNVRWATSLQQAANKRVRHKRNWREAAKHAYAVVDSFESVISSYTGSPYAVAVDSCTAALHLCCEYLRVRGNEVTVPRLTYKGVADSVYRAGGCIKWSDKPWRGMYQLAPYPIYDCARWMTGGMYKPGSLMCLSFHWTKHLPIGRGGAILCDNPRARDWFQRAANDGRARGRSIRGDKGLILGWHYYFTPDRAANGLMLMVDMPEKNDPLPNSDYPDLSQFRCYQQ